MAVSTALVESSEDQDLGFAQEGAGDAQTLFLAARDVGAALLDPCIVLVGEALDELVGAGQAAGFHALLLGGVLIAPAQVVQDGAREQDVLLQYHRDLLAQHVQVVVAHIHAAHPDGGPLSTSYSRGISCTRLDLALPVPPMTPSVSPGRMRKVISLSTGLPVPCLYLKVTWSNSTLPSCT